VTLGVRSGSIDARALGALGTRAMAGPLEADAELWVSTIEGQARTVGAFQRCADAQVRRASGGAVVDVGPGTLHVLVSLPHPAALTSCAPAQLLNRYVRPLLRALTVDKKANYFGRDWVSVAQRPVAWIGFAHDAGSGRTLIEAVCAVSSPFVIGEHVHRATFLGKAPATLEEVNGRSLERAELARAVVKAYASAYGQSVLELPTVNVVPDVISSDPPWAATGDEAIGELGAGPDASGTFRVGGDFMVSRDALARLEARLVQGDDVSRVLDETLAAPGVALEGIRSLTSLRDVIVRAKGRSSSP
jgi:hypothetical protein